MPSIWKRGSLAAFIAAGMAGLSTAADQPPCATNVAPPAWHQWQSPCPPSHQVPWQPCPPDLNKLPCPPETTPPGTTPPGTMPPETTPPGTTPPGTPPSATTPPDTAADLSFGAGDVGIGSPDVAFNSAPNMMGDLLRAYRGVTFSYLQAGDFAVANTSGAVNFRNSKVADNNSAIPRDRLTFRYNYFKEALQVNGLQPSPTLGPPLSQTSQINPFLPNYTPIRQFHAVQPASKSYDVHLYTLGLEKTFFDNLASVEVRVPFARTIDSNLNLVSGQLISDVPGVVPLVQPTPGATLGDADFELQDMNVILKAVLAQDPNRRWLVSGGLGISIPTGEDFNVRVVDYSNDVAGDEGDLVLNDPDAQRRRAQQQFAFDQRTRTFHIDNSIWGVSPYLAGVMLPTEKTFLNGFFQIEVPVNSSDWTFRERDIDLEVQANPSLASSPVQFDNTAHGTIRDQILMQIDLGGGYWLYRNPCKRRGLSGLAGILELHYTTTLDNADIVAVPETPIRTGDQANLIGPLAPPRLGNIANRLNILNATVGTQMLFGQNIAVAVGYVAPLRDGFDRTFDGELNVQLNLLR